MKIYLPNEVISWLGNSTPYFYMSNNSLRVCKQRGNSVQAYIFPNYNDFPDFCYLDNVNSTSNSYVNIYEYTNEVIARPDNYKIFSCVFIITILGVFLFNIVTSFIKRGGVFGGLL